jgi:hypothetical protein
MPIRYSNTKRNAVAAEWVAGLTHLDLYTGAQPAANAAPSGTLLGTISGLVWAAGATGVQSVSAFEPGIAAASGDFGWGRFRNAGGTEFFDGAHGTEFTMADVGVIQGGELILDSATHSVPAGGG